MDFDIKELNAFADALADLERWFTDPSPYMPTIGEILLQSTRRRIAAGVSPDGTPLAPKSLATIERYLKTGFGAATRPLIREGTLADTISYEAGFDWVEIGSSRVQSAMMQYGGTKAQFPHLWGDIPARPFLGISAQDEEDITQMFYDSLAEIFSVLER